MRALVATALALATLAASAAVVAANVDTAAAEYRAHAEQLRRTLEAEGDNCGCTADIRAKDRVASRATADATSGE